MGCIDLSRPHVELTTRPVLPSGRCGRASVLRSCPPGISSLVVTVCFALGKSVLGDLFSSWIEYSITIQLLLWLFGILSLRVQGSVAYSESQEGNQCLC